MPQSEEKAKRARALGVIASALVLFVLVPGVIALGVAVWDNRKYFLISILILILSMLPFFLSFERRKPSVRELVTLAAMIAIGVAGRAAFYMVPQFKPSAAITIITGAAFGAGPGFVAGAMIAFVSNFIFGQGPWTPWQMEAMGVIGFLAGLLFYRRDGRLPKLVPLVIYGAAAAFLVYGIIADTSTIFTANSQVSWQTLLAAYSSGIVFNLIHAAATAIFLLILARPLLKKLNRIRVKYGILEA